MIWLLLILGSIALVVILAVIFRSAAAPAIGQGTDLWYGSADGQAWDEKLRDAGSDFGLAGVRGAATAWGASITALLGVFAAVAVIKGPDSLTAVGGWPAQVAAVLILVAAAVAIVAVFLCALAAQGIPVWEDGYDAWKYRGAIRNRAKQATEQLRLSRYLVIVVLLVVAEAMAVSWLAAVYTTKPIHAMVVRDEGVMCGELSSQGGVVMLHAGDTNMRIRNANQVIIVGGCP